MIKNKKAGADWKVVMLILALIGFFIFLAVSLNIFGKSRTGIDYGTLQTRIDMCHLKTVQSDFSTGTEEKDTDDDGYFDSCDICLGYGLNDGLNSKDSDNDLYPDDCDSDPSDEKKHECTLQLCKMVEGECEPKDQCCTISYQKYLADGNKHLGLGEEIFECQTP